MAGRRFFIAIGSPACPGIAGLDSLPHVAGDVDRMAALFTGALQDYERVLADKIALGSRSDVVLTAFAKWFSDPDRRTDDCVVLYVAGHGDMQRTFGDHVLFTSNSTDDNPVSVIRTTDLPVCFFEGSGQRPQNVLLILDVCYAGQGGGEAAGRVIAAQSRVLKGVGAGF